MREKNAAAKRLTNEQLAQRIFGKKVVREAKKAVRESDGVGEKEEEPNNHIQKGI